MGRRESGEGDAEMFKILVALWAAACVAIAAGAQAQTEAQTLSGAPLVRVLRQGGYVLLMRHAASPRDPPAPAAAEPDNTTPERQLDDTGKATARAMGQAFRTVGIPVGQVLSSPTYRALQTARLAGLPTPTTAPELGDGGQSMQISSAAQAAWLGAKVAEPPKAGTDTIVITHLPNIRAAYAAQSAGLADGEALVLRPDGNGGVQFLGRVKIEDWPNLAAQFKP
jgi:phosphohistidine phosphatase SixA